MAAADLFAAAARGDAGRIRALLAKGADPDARDVQGRTPLMHATLQPAAEALLAAGARADARDGDGRTALHHACAAGRDGVAHRLLEAGLDLPALDFGTVYGLLRWAVTAAFVALLAWILAPAAWRRARGG